MTDIDLYQPEETGLMKPGINYLDTSSIKTLDDWMTVADTLRAMNQGWQWWAGDLIIHGETTLGDEIYQFFGERKAEKTWLNAAWICRQFPAEARNSDLSFSHHAILAGPDFSEDARTDLLAEAAAESWSVRELRESARQWLVDNGIVPDVGTQPPDAPDEPTPDDDDTVPADATVRLAENGLATPGDAIHFLMHRTMPELFGETPSEIVDACVDRDELDALRVQAGALHNWSKSILSATLSLLAE